jgi:hypothetical protein
LPLLVRGAGFLQLMPAAALLRCIRSPTTVALVSAQRLLSLLPLLQQQDLPR